MKDEFDILIDNLPIEKIYYGDSSLFIENSVIYKILENQKIITKEKLLDIFDKGEIVEFIKKDIDFEELKDAKTIYINIFTSKDNDRFINYYQKFLETINEFDRNINIYFNTIEKENIESIFLDVLYQK